MAVDALGAGLFDIKPQTTRPRMSVTRTVTPARASEAKNVREAKNVARAMSGSKWTT